MRTVAGVLVSAALVVSACSSSSGEMRTDVRAYLQRSATWAPIESETARVLERILATQFVDEPEVLHQIQESRPRILAHLQVVRGLAPKNTRIQKINQTYVAAWEGLLAGYSAIEEGFSSGDYTKLARGREAMAAWRDGIMDVARELRDLATEVGVEPATLTPS